MIFQDLLANVNNKKYAYILGMIYGWPLYTNDFSHIFAYSSYKTGTRIAELFHDLDMNDYYNLHKQVWINFLGINEELVLDNQTIKNNYEISGGQKIGNGVSIVVEIANGNDVLIDKEIYVLSQIEKALIDANDESKRFFIVGLMDARGSLDFNHDYVAIDIASRDHPEIVQRKLNKFNDLLGTVFNFNPRILQERANLKNDQFRIRLRYYMGHFGFINPFKIDYYKKERPDFEEKIIDNFLFTDERFVDMEINTSVFGRNNLSINQFAIDISRKNLTPEEKRLLVNKYRQDNDLLESDDEIIYSSVNIKNQAKAKAGFKCEFDSSHETFTAKVDSNQYVEAHHLIPFSKRKDFENNIDVIENMVCLCPNCHRKIHLAVQDQRRVMLENLYLKRRDNLFRAGIDIEVDDLIRQYS